MPVRNQHAGGALVSFANPGQVGEIEPGLDPVAVHVQRHDHDIKIPGALAVAEQGALHPVRTSQQTQLGGSHSRPAIVVGVQRDDDALPVSHIAAEPLDLVGVHVGRGPLHRGGQVQNHLLSGGRIPDVHDRLTNFEGIVQLGIGERFRRILQVNVGPRHGRNELLHQPGAIHGDLLDVIPRGIPEGDPPLQRGG